MHEFEEKLKTFIRDKGINCEYLHFEKSCHSVEEAAIATKANREDFIKNICIVDFQGNLIVAIVKGENSS